MRELVPVGYPEERHVELRNAVEAPLQHAVERARPRHETLAVRSCDNKIDQLVDDGVFDARQIPASLLISGCGSPKLSLLVPGRQRLPEPHDDDVEVEVIKAVLVLRTVDRPQAGRDTEPLEVLQNGFSPAYRACAVEQDFEIHRSARRSLRKLAALYLPSRRFQGLGAFAQICARVA